MILIVFDTTFCHQSKYHLVVREPQIGVIQFPFQLPGPSRQAMSYTRRIGKLLVGPSIIIGTTFLQAKTGGHEVSY
jgi:hypothetical protein